MIKETYIEADFEIVYFETEDIMTQSSGGEDPLPDDVFEDQFLLYSRAEYSARLYNNIKIGTNAFIPAGGEPG